MLKELFLKYNFTPRKSLGQNFLVCDKTRDKIIGFCDLRKSDTVLEIGPGFGILTREILKNVEKLILVEKDYKIFQYLHENINHENILLIYEDILDFNFRALNLNNFKIISALPYSISSQIVFKIIENKEYIKECFLIFQKEVALRLLASPYSKDYGPLSIFLQRDFDVIKLLDIDKSKFYPEPKINSTFIKFTKRDVSFVNIKDEVFFKRIVKLAFGMRRKTLLNNLKSLKITRDKIINILNELGYNENVRAEEIDIKNFSLLCDKLRE
jgi:16S rRNA (adenine1518-N6/adenine1519-N6)-dimethyltransferase